MNREVLEAYHASRDLRGKPLRAACYAPWVTLFFDTLGNVQACCQNTKFPLGNVAHDRLIDIWHGKRVAALRKALRQDNFGAGCQFCEWQISVGNFGGVYTRNFERFPLHSETPEWPVMMEFSISNTCNLECVMCNGKFSSLIRSNREQLPPLPKAYGDTFFDDLRAFLPHLKFAKFLGGEPFLARETFRIWDLMIEAGLRIPCHVTTNATQYDERVERVLAHLPIEFSISMDGVSPETVQTVRRNARYDQLLENFQRFHAYARRHRTYIGLTFCLMQQNWHEFGEYLLFADRWGCEVVVNVVREPPGCSLFTLPPAQFEHVVRSLEEQGKTLRDRLSRNRSVWDEHVGGLRRRLDRQEESSRAPFHTPLALVILEKAPSANENNEARFTPEIDAFALHASLAPVAAPASQDSGQAMDESRAQQLLSQWNPHATLRRFLSDKDDRLVELDDLNKPLFGLDQESCRGATFARLVARLAEAHGPARITVLTESPGWVDRAFEFQTPAEQAGSAGNVYVLRAISLPIIGAFHLPDGAVTWAAGGVLRGPAFGFDPAKFANDLKHFSDSAPQLTLEFDAQERITRVEPTEPLAGLDPNVWIGEAIEVWSRALGGRLGAAVARERWRSGAWFDDQVWTATRPGAHTALRLIRWRTCDAQQNPSGWRGCLTVAESTPANQNERLTHACERLGEPRPARFEVDAKGLIVSAHFSESAPITGWPIDATSAIGQTWDETLPRWLGVAVLGEPKFEDKSGFRLEQRWDSPRGDNWRMIRIAWFADSRGPARWLWLIAPAGENR